MLRYVICLLMLCCTARCWAQSDVNLLSDGDFEHADAHGWAEGWYRPKESGRIERVEEAGNHFAHLTITRAGDSAVMQHEVKLDPSTKALKLALRVRYHDIRRGAKGWMSGKALLMFLNASGHNTGKQYPMSWTGSSDDWAAQSVSGLVPPDAVKAKVQIALFHVQSGTLDIDDVMLTPVDPDSVQSAKPAANAAASAKAEDHPLPFKALDTDFVDAKIEGRSVDGWSIMAGKPQVLTDDNHSFVRLESAHPGDSVQIRNYVPLYHDWGKLRITTRVRYSGVQHGDHGWQSAGIITEFLDAHGKRIAAAPDPLRWHGSSKHGWVDETREYVIPMEAARLKLDPAILQAKSGTLDIASLSVTITENRADLVKGDILPDDWKPATVPHWKQTTATRQIICMNGVWKIRPIGLLPDDPKRVTAGMIQNPPVPAPAAPGLGWGYVKLPSIFPGSSESATNHVFPQVWTGVNWSSTDAVW